MKFFIFFRIRVLIIVLMIISLSYFSEASVGFALPDSVREFTLKYKSVDGLIVLPVRINNEMEVNLILDTGCRNVLLFGRSFQNIFKDRLGREIEFSGMGSGQSVKGNLSLTNTIAIGLVQGEQVPIVVIPERNIFSKYQFIHGLIGYDIFTKFEIEIHPAKRLITFRSAFSNYVPEGYTKIPMKVTDSKPVLQSNIVLFNETIIRDLLIDTGSALGLLLKSTDKDRFGLNSNSLIGKGLNGNLKGVNTIAKRVELENFVMNNIEAGIIHSPWHDYASIGMSTLKNYAIILNYAQSYACLKFVGESG